MSSLHQTLSQVRMVIAVCAVFAAVGYPASFPKPITAQQGMRGYSESSDMQCISYCSTARHGTVLMELKWRLADRLLSDAELRSKIQQQGLDVTVYTEGFERGLFATVTTLKPKAVFRTQSRKIPGLEKLSITDIATRLDPLSRSLRLMEGAESEWVMIRLEGLNPGMEYTYRVQGRQSVVTCQAVVCPTDLPIPRSRATVKRKTNRQR